MRLTFPEWTAYYNDGTSLSERDASSFYDIDRSRLERFALACSSSFTMELDAVNGTFAINGNTVKHQVLEEIAYSDYLQYNHGLVQFKKAHVNIDGMSISDETLDTVNIGYKVNVNGKLYQVLLSYDYDDGDFYLSVKTTDLEKQEVVFEATDKVGV